MFRHSQRKANLQQVHTRSKDSACWRRAFRDIKTCSERKDARNTNGSIVRNDKIKTSLGSDQRIKGTGESLFEDAAERCGSL